jgi:hypothetical protein
MVVRGEDMLDMMVALKEGRERFDIVFGKHGVVESIDITIS